MHPALEPITFLIGTWRGEGTGAYPTIESFSYGEEVRFSEAGKPHLLYTQKTWALDDDRGLHSEMGYWRPVGDGALEVVISHPTGVVEVEAGTITDGVISLQATSIARTPTAKEVTGLRRRFEVDGDTLTYDLWMAAVGRPLTHHLRAELERVVG